MKNNRGLAQIFPLIFLGATLVIAVGAVAFQNGAFKNLSKAGISCLSLRTQDQCNAQSDACEWIQTGSRYFCRGKKTDSTDKTVGRITKTSSGGTGSAGSTSTGKASGQVEINPPSGSGATTCAAAGGSMSGNNCYISCGPDGHYDYPHNDRCSLSNGIYTCKCGISASSSDARTKCIQSGGSGMIGSDCYVFSCPADIPHPYLHNKKCTKKTNGNYNCNCAQLQ